MNGERPTFTSGRRLARNVIWNLLGAGAPILVGIVAIPVLIKGLGTARFGILTLAWMVVGYFSLFDFGLGRALTKLVAEKLGAGQDDEIPRLIRTAMLLMLVLGLLGAMSLAASSPWLVFGVLKIPVSIQQETLLAFYLLAVSVPVVICTTGLRGVLEAYQCFGQINMVRAPLGVFTFLGPLLVLPFSNSLVPVVTVLVAVRLLSGCVYAVLCWRTVPAVWDSWRVQKSMIGSLVSFGGWMTVTNIVGPMLVYLDRFIIGVLISVTAVAYYTTPYEVVTKLSIIPAALMRVMFPAFSTAMVQDKSRAALLCCRAVNYVFLALFPIVIVIVLFAHEGLALWIGEEFAVSSTSVLQLLAVGIFFNSLATVPFGLIQGAGRPDITAKLHLLELPFYLLLLWWLINTHGIVGAAISWSVRGGIDTVFLFWISQRMVLETSYFLKRLIPMAGGAILLFVCAAITSGVATKGFFLLLSLSLFAVTAWFFVLTNDERAVILKRLPVKLFS